MEWLWNPESWIALITLVALELVLGIDNIVFISIQASKLPYEQQSRARRIGLLAALVMRIALLFSLSLIMSLTKPLFTILSNEISGRDLILIIGGLFLIWKSTREIHEKVEGIEEHTITAKGAATFQSVIIQIMLLDIVFSLDSIITALGMANELAIMVAAVVIAVIFMIVFADTVSAFVDNNPTIKMLALSFLLLIGVALLADGLDMHIPKGYIYFAMAFSVLVEVLNMKAGGRSQKPQDLPETQRDQTHVSTK